MSKLNLVKYLSIIVTLFVLPLVMAACGDSSSSTPEPPPTATREFVATPEQPTEGQTPGSAWARVQETGQLVVGLSADYPPFEYYTDEFTLDGFDVALIQQIAQEMGLQVAVQDLAFDGLGSALQVGQIDVAISAISVTPERDAVVDFSNVYYVSEDAILARADSQFGAIESVEQLAGYTVGVQTGTVYQRWLEDNLIDTGLMPESNLFLYQQAVQAVADLSEGRIDLVVLDLGPAQVAAGTPDLDVTIAAQGLNRERYGIAIAAGESALQTAINDALLTLQNAGYISQLAMTYLDLDSTETLPTPQPEATPGQPVATLPPPTGCLDAMMYVQDLTYDDNNMQSPPQFAPNTPFAKGWRIQNVGSCTWDSSDALVYVGGNTPAAQMSGQPTPIKGTVPPGATYDIFVDLVSPAQPGVYQGFWTLRNSAGTLFGSRLWVGIEVVGAATPTPIATQPPSADVQFWADRTNIKQGECATLYWDVQNVQAVYLYEQGQNWQDHGVNGEGSRRVCPAQTTTYDLRVVKQDGSIEVRQITINVEPVNIAPLIENFTVTPTQVTVSGCVQVQWRVSGNVTRIDVRRDSTTIWDNAPLNGVMQDCPPGPGSVNYTITASGSGGTAYREQRVNVVQ